MNVVKAAVTYFALVFGTGFVLGPIRVLWVAPRLGDRVAELLESPLLLVAMILAARWIVRRFALPPASAARLATGMLAVALVLAAEFALVSPVRGMSIADYFAAQDPVSGTVVYALQGLMAFLPLLVRRRG
jgi:hypothetical protein